MRILKFKEDSQNICCLNFPYDWIVVKWSFRKVLQIENFAQNRTNSINYQQFFQPVNESQTFVEMHSNLMCFFPEDFTMVEQEFSRSKLILLQWVNLTLRLVKICPIWCLEKWKNTFEVVNHFYLQNAAYQKASDYDLQIL